LKKHWLQGEGKYNKNKLCRFIKLIGNICKEEWEVPKEDTLFNETPQNENDIFQKRKNDQETNDSKEDRIISFIHKIIFIWMNLSLKPNEFLLLSLLASVPAI